MALTPAAARRAARGAALVGALLLLAAAAACDGLPSNYDYGTVRVHVAEPDGTPIRGVQLILYTATHHVATGATDVEGRHVFRFAPMGPLGVYAHQPAGYLVPEGARPYNDRVAVGEGETFDVELVFRRLTPEDTAIVVP